MLEIQAVRAMGANKKWVLVPAHLNFGGLIYFDVEGEKQRVFWNF